MVHSINKIICYNFINNTNIEITIASNMITLNSIKYLTIDFSNNELINLKTNNKIYQNKTILISNNINYNIKCFYNLIEYSNYLIVYKYNYSY